jgi:DNA gyrase inhibitor GyrI
MINFLSLPKNHINMKEEIPIMESLKDLNISNEKLNKLTAKDVRIIYLPPMTVAAIHIIGQDANGEHAEYTSAAILDEFIEKANLKTTYPSARNFGFNNPDGVHDDDPAHGYERWISIPDDMDVPAPLIKKHLDGGLYAAHVIPMGAWDEGWMPLYNWVDENNARYIGRWNTIDGVCGWLEEHLNYWDWNESYDGKVVNQVDLLMPVKPKFAATTKHPQETIIDTFKYNGAHIEVVAWSETVWCGKLGYAVNNTDVPDMRGLSEASAAQNPTAINERLENANSLLHFDFFTSERPAAGMFAFLVGTEDQPEGFDVKKVPAGKYMRLDLAPETAKALGVQPWNGGCPPIEWISERLAPQFGYRQVFDLPFIEYYGYLNGSTSVVNAFLYVPVEKEAK